jgi:hypothetical protein
VLTGLVAAIGCHRASPAERLSDAEFWRLVETLSEQPAAFPLSDNFVSNEFEFAEVVRALQSHGGVYIGVGPEQNFTYIAALRPTFAFIVDIRRENRNLHLLYKALFELSSDRVDFVSRLFSRLRPAGLDSSSSVDAIFEKFDIAPASSAMQADTLDRVREQLVGHHGFRLSSDDLTEMERALEAFRTDGPDIDFWRGRQAESEAPSYRQLMTARDWTRMPRSYLASHDAFSIVKRLEERNLVVPVIGDFAGEMTLRRIGDYVRTRAGTIRAFYGSNVGVYLTKTQTKEFCANLASLPTAPRALFIEGTRMRPMSAKLAACRADRGASLVFEREKK